VRKHESQKEREIKKLNNLRKEELEEFKKVGK
jgi:hypothetical protein